MFGEKVAPPSVVTAPQYSVFWFRVGSLRLSSQLTNTSPVVGSTVTTGKNCEVVVASSFTLTGALQVAPSSSECRR